MTILVVSEILREISYYHLAYAQWLCEIYAVFHPEQHTNKICVQ